MIIKLVAEMLISDQPDDQPASVIKHCFTLATRLRPRALRRRPLLLLHHLHLRLPPPRRQLAQEEEEEEEAGAPRAAAR